MIAWLASSKLRGILLAGVGGLALVIVGKLALSAYGNSRYKAGVAAERVLWEKRVAVQESENARVQQAWQAALGKAHARLAERQQQAAKVIERTTHEIKEYYRDRPADALVVCLPDSRVRAASDARAAALAAASPGRPARTVPVARASDPADGGGAGNLAGR